MPVTCGTCALWNSGTTRCRVTNAVTASGATCSLTAAQKLSLLKQSRLIAGDSSVGHPVQIISLTPCAGGGHVTIVYTVDGGVQRSTVVGIDELQGSDERQTTRDDVAAAMRDLCIMCGTVTGAAARAVLEGSTFWTGRA